MASNNRVVAVATMLFPVAAILSFVARYNNAGRLRYFDPAVVLLRRRARKRVRLPANRKS
jgi:hypothetical protein